MERVEAPVTTPVLFADALRHREIVLPAVCKEPAFVLMVQGDVSCLVFSVKRLVSSAWCVFSV